MASVRVSGERAPAAYRNTLSGMPSPISSFSEDDAFSSFYHNMLAKQNTAAPALPMKSKLRASRLIIPSSPVPVPVQQVSSPADDATTPHDVYLSSEEDASSTADDISDYDWDSESDEVCAPVSFSVSDSARIISVVYSGKPSMVELSGRRATSPGLRIRQDSASSGSSATSSPSILAPPMPVHSVSLPIRPVSMFAPTRPTSEFFPRGMSHQRSSFLNIDPYVAPPSSSHSNHSALTASPTSVTADSSFPEPAQSASSASAMFKRTIGLVRKKSRPTLNVAFPSTIREESAHSQTCQLSASQQLSPPVTPSVAPATYEDMLLRAAVGAKRNVSSPAPSTASAHPAGLLTPPQLSTPVKNRLLGLARKRASRV